MYPFEKKSSEDSLRVRLGCVCSGNGVCALERREDMFYRDDLDRILREVNEYKNDLTGELKTLPQGKLFCSENSGYRKYYQRLPAKGNRKKERRYGIKTKPEVLNGLARKEYVEKALEIIDHNIEVIGTAVLNYIPMDENTVMEELLERYPELTYGIYHEQADFEKYKDAMGRMDGFHPENLRHTASDGTMMRSKNEVYIASRLDHYGITYWSDCPTGIPGLYRIPDFTILRKRDLKIIYWEHLGMMDDPLYRAEVKIKLEEYENAGIVPWDNLILTYDAIGGGLQARQIEAAIQGWLM